MPYCARQQRGFLRTGKDLMQGLMVALGLALASWLLFLCFRWKRTSPPVEMASFLSPVLLADVLEDEFLRLLLRTSAVPDASTASALRRIVIVGQMAHVSHGQKEFIIGKLEQCFHGVESGELAGDLSLEEMIASTRAEIQALVDDGDNAKCGVLDGSV